MMRLVDRGLFVYERLARYAAAIEPIALALMRWWVAAAFWRAGVVKFDDPSSTSYLFHSEYQVPLLSPDVAAFLGTWIELITPWFLGIGLLTRPVAAFLFVYNLIAVMSYPALWPNGFWHGLIGDDFTDHKVWALMLLIVIARGAGKVSVDAALRRVSTWSHGARVATGIKARRPPGAASD